jgi:hypothetical protein
MFITCTEKKMIGKKGGIAYASRPLGTKHERIDKSIIRL